MTHPQIHRLLRTAAAIFLLANVSNSPSNASPILFSLSTPLHTEDLRGVVVGDIDGDGDLDAVLTSPANDAIIWLENGLDFWISHPVNNPASNPINGAHGVALGDIDNDGDLDIVSTARLGGTVDWWSNDNGDGTAWTGSNIAPTAPGVRGVTIADIDLDGRLDVAAAVTGANELRWWRQGATGWFGTVVETGVLDVREIVAADIDGDGDKDLVASSLTNEEVSWWNNPRTGNSTNWSATMIASVGSPHGLAAVDMDGDGDKDVIVGDQTTGQLRLLRNPTIGGPLWSDEGVSTAGSAPAVTAIGFADFDRDGDLDLLSAGAAADALIWFDNDASAGTFTARTIPTAGRTIPNAAVADLENDGDADLLVIESVAMADDQARSIHNEDLGRSARFAAQDTLIVDGVDSVANPIAHDVDGDGDIDLVYIRDVGNGNGKEVVWSENPGEVAISGGTMTTHTVGLGLFFNAVSLAVGDLDQDGDQDILIAEFDSTILFFRYCDNLNGIGTSWSCSLRLPSGASGVFDADGPMALGDIDNDGDLDAVVTTTTWGSGTGPQDGLFWFENLGDMSQTFAFTEHLVTTEQFGAQIEIIDLNNDGFSDILAAGSRSLPIGNFKVFYGDGGTTWTNTVMLSGEDLTEFDVGDIDRDGDLDIATIIEDRIRYFRQVPGGFTSICAYSFPGSASPALPERSRGGSIIYRLRGLELADLNQDGDLDILGSYDMEIGGAIVAGAPYFLANRPDTTDEMRGGDWPNWAYVELPIPNFRSAVSAIDLDGDGRLDVHYREANTIDKVVLNSGGNLGVFASDVSPDDAVGGTETDLLSILLVHREPPGEEIGLDAISLRLEDGSGNPITQGQLNAFLSSFRLLVSPPGSRGSLELAAEWQSAAIGANGEILLVLDNSDTTPLPVVVGGMNGYIRYLTLVLVPKADLGVLAPSGIELQVISGTEATTVTNARSVLVEPPTSTVASVNLVEPVLDAIFADGFELGNTSAWSP